MTEATCVEISQVAVKVVQRPTEKTTTQMYAASTFPGWWCGWTINEGLDYPRLSWEKQPGDLISHPYGAGNGTQEAPYLIQTEQELNTVALAPYDWDKHFRLVVDIDSNQFFHARPIQIRTIDFSINFALLSTIDPIHLSSGYIESNTSRVRVIL